jgi:integrase
MATITKRVGNPKLDKDGNVVRKGRVTYKAIIRMKNQKPVSKSFTRKSDATEWAKNTEVDMKANRYGLTSEAEKHTVADMINRYIALPGSKARVSYLNWWKSEIGNMTLNQVTRATIIKCRDKLATEETGTRTKGKLRSPATVNRYLAYLSMVYSAGVEWEWCDLNPVKGIKRGKENKRVRYLGMSGYPSTEAADLLKACKESDDPQLYPIVVMAMNTGCRAGELLGLDWQDIDFKRGTALLVDTKNGESRTIPVTGHTMEVLKEMRGIGKVFAAKRGSAKYDYAKSWKAAIESAGIENLKFHDLRHHAASMLAIAGMPLNQIGHLLGHKSQVMTARYAHLCDDTVSEIGAMLDKLNFPS